MALISLREYAQMHGKAIITIRAKAERGMFATARKIGHYWVIDSNEPYIDNRVTSGKYRDWRKKPGDKPDK